MGRISHLRKQFKSINTYVIVFRNPLSTLWEKNGSNINLNPLQTNMQCAKFGWNWLSSSGEEDLKFRQCIFAISNYLLLEKGEALHLDKLECLSPKDALYVASLDEIGQVVLENFLKNFVNVVLLFCNYLPLEKGGALHLYKLESPSPKDALNCAKLIRLKLAQWFWRKKMKMWKVYDKEDNNYNFNNNEDRQILITKSSLEPLAQVSKKVVSCC